MINSEVKEFIRIVKESGFSEKLKREIRELVLKSAYEELEQELFYEEQSTRRSSLEYLGYIRLMNDQGKLPTKTDISASLGVTAAAAATMVSRLHKAGMIKGEILQESEGYKVGFKLSDNGGHNGLYEA